MIKKFLNHKIKVSILIVLLCLALGRFYDWVTDGFTINNITSEFAYREGLSPIGISEIPIDEILSQKFTFLAKGGQTYAFLSADGKHVLKLIKQKHLKPSRLEKIIFRFSFFENIKQKKEERLKRRIESLLGSILISHEHLGDKTGLEYLHLSPTKQLHRTAQIVDKIGISYLIDLDRMEFMVQKKGDLLSTRINQLQEKKDFAGIQKVLKQTEDLLLLCIDRGIDDIDIHNFFNNVGFINEDAFIIDVGPFFKNEKLKDPSFYLQAKELRIHMLHDWFRTSYPELSL
jgi:hypothetical protein